MGGGRTVALWSRVLLWTARITGWLMFAALGFVVVINVVNPQGEALPHGWEWFGLAMFPLGAFVGYGIALRRSMVGGLTVLVCMAVWLAYIRFATGVLVVAAIVAAPAILHVVHAATARQKGLAE
jgi:hypothetical protein